MLGPTGSAETRQPSAGRSGTVTAQRASRQPEYVRGWTARAMLESAGAVSCVWKAAFERDQRVKQEKDRQELALKQGLTMAQLEAKNAEQTETDLSSTSLSSLE